MKVRKAVIPAAGFGTRFLPATKSQPKEMLPVVDTPVIQYVVEEAVASGITDILMIIGKGKRAIEEHFDRNRELEAELEAKGKIDELRKILRISSMADIHFVWQKEMKGLGDAVLHASSHVGNEPFAVLLGDTLIESYTDAPVTKQLIDIYEREGEPVIALEEVPEERVSRYGVADVSFMGEDGVAVIRDLVEKPSVAEAPSRLVVASRYVLTPDVLARLSTQAPGKNGEVQLTDALRAQARERPIRGLKFNGRRHDAGNRLDFLKTNIRYALKRDDLRDDLLAFMRDTVAK